MRVRFSPYVLDLESRQLLHGNDVVHLSPKAFDLLNILVSNRPKALSNGTFVGAQRVERPTSLNDGDIIRVGSVKLTLRILQPPGSTQTEQAGST